MVLVSVIFIFFSCKKNENATVTDETILKGKATIFVDETIFPIVEDEIMVFESTYDAKFTLISNSESEVLNSLYSGKAEIAIIAKNLTDKELKFFEQKKIVPKITKFASDGIAFVSNKSNNDTLIALKDVIDFLNGVRNSRIKGLVFDNPNSSTVNYINNFSKVNALNVKDVYSMKTNNEVLKFVSENDGMVGVVGVNWLSQPNPSMNAIIDNLNILSVKGLKGEKYFSPSQNDLAEGNYPLTRDLYIVNCQGTSGLGMGIASFVAGDIGQRIVLKSGLLPNKLPGRNINIVHEKLNDKKVNN